MFEYLELGLNEGFEPHSVKIYARDGKIFYDIFIPEDGRMEDGVESDQSVDEFMKLIEGINISKWKNEYQPRNIVILDGASWYVELKQNGKLIEKQGDNAFPTNWESLISIVETVASDLDCFRK